MPKLLPPATAVILAILASLLACQGATPTSSPTEGTVHSTVAATPVSPPNTPEPEATATPASSPEPTTTESTAAAPTATPTIPATPPPGILAPLPIQDPQALLSSLSDAELDCIGEPDRLVQALAGLGTPAKEVLTELFGCLEDETLVRLFLASFVPVTDPLSPQSSQCVWAAFDVIEPRKVMTAGMEGGPGAAMAGSMAALTSTLACLNETEWEAVAPKVGIDPEERGEVLCLLEELGGAAELATALMEAGQGDSTAISRAGVGCGMNPEPGPTPMEVPATPTPTEPKPESTPVSTTAPTPTTAPPTSTKAPATPTLTPTPEPTATAGEA